MITTKQLTEEVMAFVKERPSFIRLGQAVFTYIDQTYGIARRIQFKDGIDCFYDDHKVERFIAAAAEIINEKQRERHRRHVKRQRKCDNCMNCIFDASSRQYICALSHNNISLYKDNSTSCKAWCRGDN